MKKPLSKLTIKDFQHCPIWKLVLENGREYAEPTHHEFYISDEDVPDLKDILIVRTKFILHDKTEHEGFCSPWDETYAYPVIITSLGQVPLETEDIVPAQKRDRMLEVLGKTKEQVFPVKYECTVTRENGNKFKSIANDF